MRERWILDCKNHQTAQLAEKFGISERLARIITNRGVQEDQIDLYLHGTCEQLAEPAQMKHVMEAAALIEQAITAHVKIVIATDFDTDGIMSAFVLKTCLTQLGAQTSILAPDRVTEGYGLNNRIIDEAIEMSCGLLITCDNGIACAQEIQYAKQMGMTVIVTDHHEVPYSITESNTKQYMIPDADCVINPKQQDCNYPFKELCGAGVIYRLTEYLYDHNAIERDRLYELLPFVCIATVADVMELTGENRILVREGLARFSVTRNLGLAALLEVNGLQAEQMQAYQIGFVLGPCFNAAGRLENVMPALHLLEAKDSQTALQDALYLKKLNDERKQMTIKGFTQAINSLESHDGKRPEPVLLIVLEDIHESLAGIIAGRLRERYHRPVFVFTNTKQGLKGSGRSIEAYSMYEALNRAGHLLTRFGGHKMAAGLSLPEENLEMLRETLIAECGLSEEDLTPTVHIDAAVSIGCWDIAAVEELTLLEPFGKGNPKPLFAQQHVRLSDVRVFGEHQNVLRFRLADDKGDKGAGVCFEPVAQFEEKLTEEYHCSIEELYGARGGFDIGIVYTPKLNCYRDLTSVQLEVSHYCRIVP